MIKMSVLRDCYQKYLFCFGTKARYQKTKNNVCIAVKLITSTFSSLKETPKCII